MNLSFLDRLPENVSIADKVANLAGTFNTKFLNYISMIRDDILGGEDCSPNEDESKDEALAIKNGKRTHKEQVAYEQFDKSYAFWKTYIDNEPDDALEPMEKLCELIDPIHDHLKACSFTLLTLGDNVHNLKRRDFHTEWLDLDVNVDSQEWIRATLRKYKDATTGEIRDEVAEFFELIKQLYMTATFTLLFHRTPFAKKMIMMILDGLDRMRKVKKTGGSVNSLVDMVGSSGDLKNLMNQMANLEPKDMAQTMKGMERIFDLILNPDAASHAQYLKTQAIIKEKRQGLIDNTRKLMKDLKIADDEKLTDEEVHRVVSALMVPFNNGPIHEIVSEYKWMNMKQAKKLKQQFRSFQYHKTMDDVPMSSQTLMMNFKDILSKLTKGDESDFDMNELATSGLFKSEDIDNMASMADQFDQMPQVADLNKLADSASKKKLQK